MRPSLKNLPKRSADKARSAAAGSDVPAGQEPVPENAPVPPTAGDRGAMRRRARKIGRMREVLLRELGALVVEMRRLDRDNPELVRRKAAEVLAVDEELRGLRTALGERHAVEQVVAAGVAGNCRRCGTLLGVEDRFCSHCGLAMAEEAAGAEHVSAGVEPESAESASAGAEPRASAPAPASVEAAGAEPNAAGAEPASAGAEPKAAGAEPPAAMAPPPPPPPPPPPSDGKTTTDGNGARPAPEDTRTTELTATARPQP